MGRGKYASPGVTMADVASWREAISETYDVRVRYVLSQGADANSWRVSAQAVLVQEGKAKVVTDAYDVWPRRGVSSIEAMLLQLAATLDRQLEPTRGVFKEPEVLP